VFSLVNAGEEETQMTRDRGQEEQQAGGGGKVITDCGLNTDLRRKVLIGGAEAVGGSLRIYDLRFMIYDFLRDLGVLCGEQAVVGSL
jgi:hypothetical protein